ncbi:MAG: Gfo/Idh/MocA family oxidoreductase [Candidatus Omnitrophica bacterium]|nr:Gfo/Idh/MocA family oxidoreductase [Candidatus Omnitrophota bacterium]MCF7877128.1 Gfo/Idh/MocA family oxidoreductase [Candidatus Omnitrophota bacterium]MCF7878731.1 Gfo/Idh/MocA family oxidoreductase [Candidatus Omnitrophota bacterium]MCF7892798.1 Gfo/Idh/MocA family oxidoreductase [Candidatus Omnitrophota bacterium]
MLKAAIIGLGKLGSIHLRIYKESKKIEKIYLVDTDKRALKEPGLPVYSDYRSLKDKVDLVSIATPTSTHFEIARFFLENKIPVLVEKPISKNPQEAKKLIKIAQKNKTLIFVGHVERFNSAYLKAKETIKNPLFIECHRLSPYPHRSLDISVVLDLMIHDLDIILDLASANIKKIEAKGVKVLSNTADIANCRISFKNGCVANITSSRISLKKERKIRIFMPNKYVSIDYANQSVDVYQKEKNQISQQTLKIEKKEPLKKEINHFIEMVDKKSFDISSAQGAKNALLAAAEIEKIINEA